MVIQMICVAEKVQINTVRLYSINTMCSYHFQCIVVTYNSVRACVCACVRACVVCVLFAV